MSRGGQIIVIVVLLAAVAGVAVYILRAQPDYIGEYNQADRDPKIRPDYRDIVIPPNIAALNFLIEEQGTGYCVKIHSKQAPAIEVFSKTPKIIIPQNRWRQLLSKNKGQDLYFDIFVKNQNQQWRRFSTITNKIAAEEIDGYLVYRKFYAVHNQWGRMGIYQRNISNYDESLILDNTYFRRGCVNCHSFCNNRTNKMLIGFRSKVYGSSALLVNDKAVGKIGSKLGYTAWHPSGRMAVYSVNRVAQFFRSARSEIRDVLDLDSMLAYYLVDSAEIKTTPQISVKERLETYPAWSPDGKWLYFSSAEIPWSDLEKLPPDGYEEVKYDLMRISYDIDSDKWGQLETVLSAKDSGYSILEPRISPDGRWLLFCMCDYGPFPVYQQSSDLYLLDLKAAKETGRYEYQKLEINSDQSESWHSWSSNSRWIAFSSKRDYGVFTRSYISYIDETGKAYKPILLPQKDPEFYDSCLNTYSVPEFITEPVRVTKEKLGRVVRGSGELAVKIPVTMATPVADKEPWQLRE